MCFLKPYCHVPLADPIPVPRFPLASLKIKSSGFTLAIRCSSFVCLRKNCFQVCEPGHGEKLQKLHFLRHRFLETESPAPEAAPVSSLLSSSGLMNPFLTVSPIRASPSAAPPRPPRYTLGCPLPPRGHPCLPALPFPCSPPQLVILCKPVPALRGRKEEVSRRSVPQGWLFLCSPLFWKPGPPLSGKPATSPALQALPDWGGPGHGNHRGPLRQRQVLGILVGETLAVSRGFKWTI